MSGLPLEILPATLAITRLPPDAEVPSWAGGTGRFCTISRTAEELSVVCRQDAVPAGVRHEGGWRCLRVAGTLDFGLVGVLAALLGPLAAAGVSVFVVSTFDTDYVLVRDTQLEEATAALLDGRWFRYLIAASFVVMAGWTLIPDRLDEDQARPARFGIFVTTLVAFFLVEMGDKTQLATIALGARFHSVVAVMLGTTLGMMIANVPAVLFGNALIKQVPLKVVRIAAALLFLAVGLWLLAETAGSPW